MPHNAAEIIGKQFQQTNFSHGTRNDEMSLLDMQIKQKQLSLR